METVSIPGPVPGGLPPALLLVMRLSHVFRREFIDEMGREDWVRHADAGPPMYGVLRAVGYLRAPSQRDIAQTIGLDPSDLVGVLDRMETNGWLFRERDPADRRRSLVRLTEEGQEVLDRYNAVARRVGDRMMTGLDEDEREEFTRLAVRMLRATGDDLFRGGHQVGREGPHVRPGKL